MLDSACDEDQSPILQNLNKYSVKTGLFYIKNQTKTTLYDLFISYIFIFKKFLV